MTKENWDHMATSIRLLTAEMLLARGDGHIGGAFSIADALAVLFHSYIDQDTKVKDYFILSKGHAGPSYYATLALLGHLPREEIMTLNKNGTRLPSHPDRLRTPGVDFTTGSLGQGISQAVGIAFGLKKMNKAGMVYCIIGDGECNEGEVYEALQFAGNKHLDNLIILLDYNKKQVDGELAKVSCNFDFPNLIKALDLVALNVNGHDTKEISKALDFALSDKGNAHVLILDTMKGYGIPYFEKQFNPHHVTFDEQAKQALKNYIEKTKLEVEGWLGNYVMK